MLGPVRVSGSGFGVLGFGDWAGKDFIPLLDNQMDKTRNAK